MSQRSHAAPSKLLGTFAAQTLAARYDAGPSAADWRRFGRLPGFTNCKPKYRKLDGLFPFVRLYSHTGQQYPMAEAFVQEITKLYDRREQELSRCTQIPEIRLFVFNPFPGFDCIVTALKFRIVAHKTRTKFLLKFVRDISTKMTLTFLRASVSVRDLSTNSSTNSGI
jgi:hypothetical protein